MKGKGLKNSLYIFGYLLSNFIQNLVCALYLSDKTLICNVGLYPLALDVIAHYQ